MGGRLIDRTFEAAAIFYYDSITPSRMSFSVGSS